MTDGEDFLLTTIFIQAHFSEIYTRFLFIKILRYIAKTFTIYIARKVRLQKLSYMGVFQANAQEIKHENIFQIVFLETQTSQTLCLMGVFQAFPL